MMNYRAAFIFFFISTSVVAQPSVMELPKLLGECKPEYAAAFDNLDLFESPNLDSLQVKISYRNGWLIPYKKRDGVTRIISFGEVKTVREETLIYCITPPTNGNTGMVSGDTATYLYYLGEGIAEVLVRGAECQLDISEVEVLKYPEVQSWIRVLFRDASSPGWLLNNGEQTMNTGLKC